VDDEVLARAPSLVGVMPAGVDERLAHTLTIDRHGRLISVLFDDREEVVEQALLGA
jgi:hypothetical protein